MALKFFNRKEKRIQSYTSKYLLINIYIYIYNSLFKSENCTNFYFYICNNFEVMSILLGAIAEIK